MSKYAITIWGSADGHYKEYVTDECMIDEHTLEEHNKRIRAEAIAEVRNGINDIISEYGVDGKVLSDLVIKYMDSKCDWLKENKDE